MTTSALRRQVKNIVHNYSEAEIKVREATSNDPWGPSSSLMSEIADLTFSVVAFSEVMSMVWKRLNDHGKNWRHVYKALTLLDYLAKTGSERVAQQCRENAFTIQTLRDFQYVDRDGRDQGLNVREKAKQLAALLRDDERLRQERAQALKTKERMAGGGTGGGGGGGGGGGVGGGGGGGLGGAAVPPAYPGRRSSQPSMAALYGEEFSRSRGSPSSFNSSSSSPRASDLEQTRPQTSGEEELQLQLALAMSRQESQKHSRQGDDSFLQKALDESRRADEPGTGEHMRDLVDIFGPVSEAPPSEDPWDTQPSCPVNSDPWESVAVVNSSTPVIGSPWMGRRGSSSPSQPWGCSQSSTDPWEAPPSKSSPNSVNHAWKSPTNNGDPFSAQEEEGPREEEEGLPNLFSPRAVSPADSDPFGDSVVVAEQVNGRVGDESPETFDLSRLGPPLTAAAMATATSPRPCRTPEAFLGPTAASLVNLDTLIPANPPTTSRNPFLSGLSAPSPTNPFHCDQPRLTLNQLRPCSTSPLPPPAHTSSSSSSSLPYSASLPLPVPRHAAAPSLPSSFTQPPQGLLDLPSNLPQPLLPLSSAPMLLQQQQQQQHNNHLHHNHHHHHHHQQQQQHPQRFSPQPRHLMQPQSHSHNPFL
ncbi:epsin-3 isoform X2 [Alosa sapidissima]|uniref:epsin-3 isoform X2 n=1 Tax=Alosa sapidissima TaxID=34773 RepID=UPI001C085972|nr:epsin-3 isoform X2 [Alosa sapidissima]